MPLKQLDHEMLGNWMKSVSRHLFGIDTSQPSHARRKHQAETILLLKKIEIYLENIFDVDVATQRRLDLIKNNVQFLFGPISNPNCEGRNYGKRFNWAGYAKLIQK